MAVRREEDGTVVDRYGGFVRVNHWVTAISLILLALSGAALFHPSLFFLSGLFGGGANMNHGISLESFLYSLIGAIILLAIVNLIRRGTVR